MLYPHRTPRLLQWLLPGLLWSGDKHNKQVYLTFDDGPVPEATDFVLDILAQYNVRATFFCVGHNVYKHPETFQAVKTAGHQTANHTYHHLDGWKHGLQEYMQDIAQCEQMLQQQSGKPLFRPPYGKMPLRAVSRLQQQYRVVMWSLLSGDFDKGLSPERCLAKCKKYTRPGSIVLFHDSPKTLAKLREVLPAYLDFLQQEGYTCALL